MDLRARFHDIIAKLGPFEKHPHVAVAVSGGPDSLALTLLLHEWLKDKGGTLHAITVDHRLRPASAEEAKQVGEWLAAYGISHHTLVWHHESKPKGNLQAAARNARYALLTEWCRTNGVLHLCVAHHAGDQAETFLMRQERSAGVEGLASISMLSERLGVRILRPLLPLNRALLTDFLRAQKQPWIEDPSNRITAFNRIRTREALAEMQRQGLDIGEFAAAAHEMGKARLGLEQQLAGAMAQHVRIFPEGYAAVSGNLISQYSPTLVMRLLGQIAACIGGGDSRPRWEESERLFETLFERNSPAATLGGALFRFSTREREAGILYVFRETQRMAPALALNSPDARVWDGRFSVSFEAASPAANLRVAALGQSGWLGITPFIPPANIPKIPKTALYALPALWHLEEVLHVPHIDYRSAPPTPPQGPPLTSLLQARFTPVVPLTPASFFV